MKIEITRNILNIFLAFYYEQNDYSISGKLEKKDKNIWSLVSNEILGVTNYTKYKLI